ncbi:MAG: alpha/beta fold hydrolase [Actinomycetia bacterium]|nr:alpha/beta fold hydrolase [Actinomycetes bacterium]
MTIPQQQVRLDTCALTLWGRPSDRLVVTVHGLHSHQGDADTQAAVRQALARNEQALTWDLPGHGVRPGTPEDCRVTDAAAELAQIWDWACARYGRLSVFATSLGAYLALLTARQDRLDAACFLSPVVDMVALVDLLMAAAGTTADEVREKGRVETPAGPLVWDQLDFILTHRVENWIVPTRILRGQHDEVVPERSVHDFCTRFAAELTVVPGAGHHLHRPAELAAVARWLAAGEPTTADP